MKKWMWLLLVALIAGGVYWGSDNTKKVVGKQTEMAEHKVLTFQDGAWYCAGEKIEKFEFDLFAGENLVEFKASGDLEMGCFEAVMWCLKESSMVDAIFTDLDTGRSVKIDGLSDSDRQYMQVQFAEFVSSAEDTKTDVVAVGIAGNVLGAHFEGLKYDYAHLDGRGMEHFRSSFKAERTYFMGMGALKETSLSQFIQGAEVFKSTGAIIVPIVSNEYMMFVFSEARIVSIEDEHGVVNKLAEESLVNGVYKPERSDFPVDIDLPEMNIVEKDLPMTIPEKTSTKMVDINPFFISIEANGSIRVNLSKRKFSLETLRAKLNDYSNESASVGAKPIIQIKVHPEAKQQKVIDVLNEIRGANINTVTFTEADIEERDLKPRKVERIEPMEINVYKGFDPDVKPSVAYQAVKVDEKFGRIVINVRDDGTFSQADYTKVMKTSEELQTYIKMKKKELGELEHKLHLRGSEDALFKHSQIVMKAAAEAGVTRAVFSVYNAEESKK